MTNLAESFSCLSRFLDEGESIRTLHLRQMPDGVIAELVKATDWMITHCQETLSDLGELDSWLNPFSEYMRNDELGVIDGRSWNDAQLPGKTWLQIAEEEQWAITVNSLKNLQSLIEATRPQIAEEGNSEPQ